MPGCARACVMGLVTLGCLLVASPAMALGPERFSIPSSAKQLIVVSSRTYDPPGYLAAFQTFQRANASEPWEQVFGTWRAEIGSGDLVNVRHFGDHATPTGVFAIGARMYGNEPNPGGLHYAYRQLVCGDWWDEDPYSPEYNQFVHVPCGTTPTFASWSEALWTETRAYPYLAVLQTNNDPTITGANAPGAGIFLHHWMNAPTQGCVALPLASLLKVLRWLDPAKRPVIDIGTDAEIGPLPAHSQDFSSDRNRRDARGLVVASGSRAAACAVAVLHALLTI
jgi:L,D-peptidoglycan transpeptidase YkuD (ErfK/YbiS/YcfS/YnhG family)